MKPSKLLFLIPVIGVLIVIAYASLFILPEGRQAVITQFGKPIKSVKDAGLHLKLPFVHDVRMIDLRVLSWDGYPNQIPTKDKKYIEVDTTARWKIIDPLKFIQTVQNERGARSRLDAILDGVTRDIISGNNLVEAVRNSNNILDVIKERSKSAKKSKDKKDEGSTQSLQEEITGEVEPIEVGRERLSALIAESAKQELLPLGIELIDVQLKRIAYEESVQRKVYGRMISERERIAEKILSFGKGEQAKIQGKTDRDLKLIESDSYRQVQEIKGKAEAEAIKIYAQALQKNPDFYRFVRSLEAYEKSLPKDSTLLMSSESRFWKALRKGQ